MSAAVANTADSTQRRRLRGAGALALAVSCIAYADHQIPVTALFLSNTRGLEFGAFAAGSGGSVVIAPAGTRSATGDVVLISSNTGAAAQFSISGDVDFTYSITLPADGTVTLSDGAGHSMNVNSFTSSPLLTGQLNPAGSQQLAVGATLNVGSNQPAGGYSGGFIVTVNYD